MRLCISFDDVIDYFSKFKPIQGMEETHERAMNRLKYENEKSKGAVIIKIPRLRGRGYFEKCGNCGNEAVKEAWYKYCPNCGYKVIRESE